MYRMKHFEVVQAKLHKKIAKLKAQNAAGEQEKDELRGCIREKNMVIADLQDKLKISQHLVESLKDTDREGVCDREGVLRSSSDNARLCWYTHVRVSDEGNWHAPQWGEGQLLHAQRSCRHRI